MQAYKKTILRIAELGGAFAYLRHKTRFEPVVLMYHRVIDNPLIDAVHPAVFSTQMAYLKKHYRVISMDQLVQEMQSGSIKPMTVALTFDDGHYDFYKYAWPVLKQYEMPASLYVTTDFVDKKQWLWPDQVKYMLANTTVRQIDLPPFGRIALQRETVLDAWHQIADRLLEMGEEERANSLAALAETLELTITGESLEPFAPVSWIQLNEMMAEGLDVGAHSVSHPALGRIDEQQLDFELRQSAQRIFEKLGSMPSGACYPFGRKEDVSAEVFRCAEKLGYSYGLVAYSQKISADKIFQIGRVSASNDFLEFRWRLLSN